MDPRLFDAAFTGNVNALLELIQQDPLILHTVTVTTSNTPLHIAALLGHAEFAMVVMQYCPQFAKEVNQEGHAPIHLASAKGHLEIVKEMLVRQPDLAYMKDEDGQNFLHTAAARGRLQVLMELFSPELAKELTLNGETVLHLAVRNNQYKALETLIHLANQHQIGNELLNAEDRNGNTILHLAYSGKKSKMVELLASEPNVDTETVDLEGHTATAAMPSHQQKVGEGPIGSRIDELVHSMRNGIHILAGVFATLSFGVAMNPPGGVWQDWTSNSYPNATHVVGTSHKSIKTLKWWHYLPLAISKYSHLPNLSKANVHKPGLSVNRELNQVMFFNLLQVNTVAFFLSLSIILFFSLSEILNLDSVQSSIILLVGICALFVCGVIEFVQAMVLIIADRSLAYFISAQALFWILFPFLFTLGLARFGAKSLMLRFLHWLFNVKPIGRTDTRRRSEPAGVPLGQ